MSSSPDPDPDQRRVVQSRARTLRLVAPAGSGKTQTIVARVESRVAAGVAAECILLLTFDTAAARSLRERLTSAAAPPVSTLNAFGYALLRAWAPAEYRRVVARPSALAGAARILARSPASAAALPARPAETALAAISLLKNALFDPRSCPPEEAAAFLLRSRHATRLLPIEARDRPPAARLLADVFGAYERWLRRIDRMDFDDQKLRAWAALDAAPDLKARVRARYAEVIVDEFQDINRLDFELIRTIAAESALVVAGDDDQAIYGFRGCTADYILSLSRHLRRPVTSLELRTNYRNPPNVIRIAGRLIRHNRRRIPKHPRAHRREDARVELCAAASRPAEARGIAALGERVLADPDGGTAAVLYRLNAQSIPLQIALIGRGVPYTVRPRDDLLAPERVERLVRDLKPGTDPAGEDLLEALDAVEAREERSEEDLDDDADAGAPFGGWRELAIALEGRRNDFLAALTAGLEARRRVPADARRIELRTYFRAKGLQWDTVFLPGCNEGVLPHARAPVEDERRLFYVALTRASARLVLSYVTPAAADGAPPSPFLLEAGLLEPAPAPAGR